MPPDDRLPIKAGALVNIKNLDSSISLPTMGFPLQDVDIANMSATKLLGGAANQFIRWVAGAAAWVTLLAADIIAILGFTPENVANKNANNGYLGLDANGFIGQSFGAANNMVLTWNSVTTRYEPKVSSGGGLTPVANTKNLLKARKTANQTITSLVFADVTDLNIGLINPKQVVAVLISYNKSTSGTCQFRAIGVTSSTVYWLSPVLASASAAVELAVFVMTGGVAENVKIQALSSENVNGVIIKGQGASSTTCSGMMCGDIALVTDNVTQSVSTGIQFEASSIDYASYLDKEIINSQALAPSLFTGIGKQDIDVNGVAVQIQTATYPTTVFFNGLTIRNTQANYGIFMISFTGNWLIV